MRPFLETDRLALRRFTEADVDALVELDSDPAVMRYITGGRPTSRDEIRDDVLPAFLAYYERSDGYGFWAATERRSGEFLGWFHLRPPPGGDPDEPELGYRLRRSAWGRGYATEGARALVDKAFDDLGARRVYAETMAVNVASRRVMEKAGLVLVRAFRQDWPVRIDGDEHGDVEYALTRAEWERRRRETPLPATRSRTSTATAAGRPATGATLRLEGRRVVLRPLRADEVDAVLDAHERDAVAARPGARRRDRLRRRLARSGRLVRGHLDLAVEVDGRLVGEVQARGDPAQTLPPGVFELGVDVHDPADRGGGIGGEAVALLTGWLFEHGGAARVQASTAVGNTAMRRVLERLGFAHEGDMRAFMPEGPTRTDYALYATTSADWPPPREGATGATGEAGPWPPAREEAAGATG